MGLIVFTTATGVACIVLAIDDVRQGNWPSAAFLTILSLFNFTTAEAARNTA